VIHTNSHALSSLYNKQVDLQDFERELTVTYMTWRKAAVQVIVNKSEINPQLYSHQREWLGIFEILLVGINTHIV